LISDIGRVIVLVTNEARAFKPIRFLLTRRFLIVRQLHRERDFAGEPVGDLLGYTIGQIEVKEDKSNDVFSFICVVSLGFALLIDHSQHRPVFPSILF